MSIKDELAAELKDALKAKDRARLDVIRQITTEVSKAAAEPGFSGEVDDALHQRVIAAYTKKMEKARAEYVGYGERGADMAAKLGFEIDYLQRWLPAAGASDVEIDQIVRDALNELGADGPKQAGRVIGHIMKTHPGLDGGKVNAAVRAALGGG